MQKAVREIMVFLQSHSISSTMAHRIYKTYGEDAIKIVSENPYKLAADIRGIGFKSADVIASNLGIAKDSLIRARAGITHILLEATGNGHCFLPLSELVVNIDELLEIDRDLTLAAIEAELKIGALIKANVQTETDNQNEMEVIFLASYYFCEKNTAKRLNDIKLSVEGDEWGAKIKNIDKAISDLESKNSITLSNTQKLAVTAALSNKVMVITGGPGTGKTTILGSILKILKTEVVGLKIKLCAPTGRAAKRLSETAGMEAVTIHRLLEVNYAEGGFVMNEENKLDADYLVIDEASMVDVSLMNGLLKSIKDNSSLLIVGDVDQLPSVGPGQVLKDIIDSKVIKVIKLTEIFRQAETSQIIRNAHLVNRGQMIDLSGVPEGQDSDFYFIEADPKVNLLAKLKKIIEERIPQKFGFDPVTDIQVLAPMQRGGFGVRALNIELQKILNKKMSEVKGIHKYGSYFALNDKVMQLENDYDKEVYNGDIGIIKSIDDVEQELVIRFDDRDVVYDYVDLDQITHAYAVTIHKSQGSEYPVVVIPLTMQSYIMLQKNLLYTAITRGKKFVVIIGEKKALEIAIKKRSGLSRYTNLAACLRMTL